MHIVVLILMYEYASTQRDAACHYGKVDQTSFTTFVSFCLGYAGVFFVWLYYARILQAAIERSTKSYSFMCMGYENEMPAQQHLETLRYLRF